MALEGCEPFLSSELCDGKRLLSVMYITNFARFHGYVLGYVYVLGRWKAVRSRTNR